jgi:hypothetical protein
MAALHARFVQLKLTKAFVNFGPSTIHVFDVLRSLPFQLGEAMILRFLLNRLLTLG